MWVLNQRPPALAAFKYECAGEFILGPKMRFGCLGAIQDEDKKDININNHGHGHLDWFIYYELITAVSHIGTWSLDISQHLNTHPSRYV